MNSKNNFNQKLHYLLFKSGKTQAQLADYLNVPRTTVSGWFNGGKFPRYETLMAIADFFNIPASELLSERPPLHEQTVFIKNIKNKLANDRMSVNEFAIRLDMPLSAVIKFLDGKEFPDDDTVLKITKALNTTYNELITDENDEEVMFLARSIQGLTDAQKSIIQNMIKELHK